jgi:dTDP-4-dehydrorhamnose 3,5-epimerase
VIVRPTELPEVMIVQPSVHADDRGFLVELFNESALGRAGLAIGIRQINHSRSHRGVLRGLHFQEPNAQGKLVAVTRGEIFDVAVDVRRDSPTFGEWVGVNLAEGDSRSVWIPPGFAHGFCVLSEIADVIYASTEVYEESAARGVLWSDPSLGIRWPVEQPRLSPRDASLPPLDPRRSDLPPYAP